MQNTPVYKTIADWLARLNPQAVAAFEPDEETKSRVEELIFKQSEGSLSDEELDELNHYLYLENIIGLAQAEARQLLRA